LHGRIAAEETCQLAKLCQKFFAICLGENMDTKKLFWIGGGTVVVIGAYYWYKNYAANQSANTDQSNQNDAELAALMLEQPLAYGSASDSSASVSGPTVDTGNNQLQSLISSILNPTTPTPSTSTSSTPVTANPVSPVSGTGTVTSGPSTVTPQPVTSTPYNPVSTTDNVAFIQPDIKFVNMQVGTNTI
jgi:hypothetical protein